MDRGVVPVNGTSVRVLVTRPAPQAETWAAGLRAQGVDAAALPLIEIQPPDDTQAVTDLWGRLSHVALLMFVSPAAVEWFFRLRPAQAAWPAQVLAAAPGPGTARALAEAGPAGPQPGQILSPPADAPQFDSEHLWPVLHTRDWSGKTVCIVSGGQDEQAQGRQWLAERLRQAGAQVFPLLTYRRGPAHWDLRQQTLARDALERPGAHAWLLSSSQAVDHLTQTLLPGAPWHDATALVTHPRIGERAARAGFGRVLSSRPTIEAVVNALRPAEEKH